MNDTPDSQPTPQADKDWLVLLSQSEVVGPLSAEDLRACIADGQIPATARLFRFQASPDAEEREASLRAQAAKLGADLLAQEDAVRRLQADLKARDLEFEGERQQMSADMSKLRADNLRKNARIETLEQSTARLAEVEKTQAEAERRFRDEERRAARLASEAAAAREEVESLKRQSATLQESLDAARERLRDKSRRLGEMVKTLSALAEEPDVSAAETAEAVEEPAPANAARRKPTVRAVPLSASRPEVVEPVVELPGAEERGPAGPARSAPSGLASLEARARQELDMLQKRGASAPGWARRKS